MNHSSLWPNRTIDLIRFAMICALVGCVWTDSSAQDQFLEFRYEFDSDEAPLVDTTGQNANLGLGQNGVEHRLGEPSLVGGNGFSVGLDAPGNNHPTGSYLTALDVPHPESFSYSIWIQPRLTGQIQAILDRDNVWWPSPCAYYCLYIDPSQALVWKTGGVETIISEDLLIEDDELYHLVVTHLDSDGLDSGVADRSRLYVNGELLEEAEDPEEIPSLDSIADANDIFRFLWVGTLSSRGGFLGEIDDFQFYSTELSADQVAEMYARPGSVANFGDASPLLQPGDANQDLSFDQLDIVQVSIAAKYLTGQSATWGEGDWDGAPGGEPGSPPAGNGLFDQVDIIAALAEGKYLTGPYAALAPDGELDDEQTTLVYDNASGQLSVDAPASTELTSIFVTSASNTFLGDKPPVLDGPFDSFAADNIFKSTIGSSFGDISFGNVLPAGLSETDILADLSASGSLSGGGGLGDVDLVYIPEPTALILIVVGLAAILLPRRSKWT